MFVRRIGAPVAAGCERLADDQAPGGQFGLSSQSEDLVIVAFEVCRALHTIRNLRGPIT